MDVSIVIVNWNARDVLRGCLKSIYGQTEGIEFEVIVVDNASSDASAAMVAEEFPQATVIRNSENRGFAAANNQGIAIAKGRYVLLLNPDTVVLDGAIHQSVRFAEQNPSAAVIGVRIERPDGTLCRDCFRYASTLNLAISTFGMHRLFPNSRLWGRERYSWWDYQSVREVEVVAGCFMLVSKAAIDRVGGLDESYFMYGEEMDWCWRFRNGGWQVLYYPEARIVHYGGVSAAQNPVAMSVHSQRSLLRFIRKRQGRMGCLAARGLLLAAGVMRVFYWCLRWVLGPRRVRSLCSEKLRKVLASSFGY